MEAETPVSDPEITLVDKIFEVVLCLLFLWGVRLLPYGIAFALGVASYPGKLAYIGMYALTAFSGYSLMGFTIGFDTMHEHPWQTTLFLLAVTAAFVLGVAAGIHYPGLREQFA